MQTLGYSTHGKEYCNLKQYIVQNVWNLRIYIKCTFFKRHSLFCILECQKKKTVRESTDLSLLRLVFDHRVFVMLNLTDDKITEVILFQFPNIFISCVFFSGCQGTS